MRSASCWITIYIVVNLAVLLQIQIADCKNSVRSKRQRDSISFGEMLFGGDTCQSTLNGGLRGVCRRITECPGALQIAVRNPGGHPDICSWDGIVPIVCCTVVATNAGAMSAPLVEDTTSICGRRTLTALEGGALFRRKRRNRVGISVVGGKPSGRYSWPWMAAIFVRKNGARRANFLCGASLINKRYVLTAAHCFNANGNDVIDPSIYSVVLGAHIVRGLDQDGTTVGVDSVKLHEKFVKGIHYNDIALVRLSRDVAYQFKINPVCLPPPEATSKANLTGRSSVITGWGDTTFGGVSSKELHEVSVPIILQSSCARSYSNVGKSAFPDGIDDSLVCAGYPQGGKDACQGDSGGPLVHLQDGGTQWTQVGIVSFGYGCAVPGYPGVYTRVGYFRKWIEQHAGV